MRRRRRAQDRRIDRSLGDYLRRLRLGYRYTLRQVEERAREAGGELEKSQISRYEAGLCYPSFETLRLLSRVYCVRVQTFFDVVEAADHDCAICADAPPAELLEEARQAVVAGVYSRGFATYQRLIRKIGEASDGSAEKQMLHVAQVERAHVLRRLGHLALAEAELKLLIRDWEQLPVEVQTKTMLVLADVDCLQGDFHLASLHADEARRLADVSESARLEAIAVSIKGRALAGNERPQDAIPWFQRAVQLFSDCDRPQEAIRFKLAVGECYVRIGKHREGLRLLRACLDVIRVGRHRRLLAVVWNNLGAAYYQLGDDRARDCFRESDIISKRFDYHDVMFENAYYLWRMAERAESKNRAQSAFRLLTKLRPKVEAWRPEVKKFDAFVLAGGAHA